MSICVSKWGELRLQDCSQNWIFSGNCKPPVADATGWCQIMGLCFCSLESNFFPQLTLKFTLRSAKTFPQQSPSGPTHTILKWPIFTSVWPLPWPGNGHFHPRPSSKPGTEWVLTKWLAEMDWDLKDYPDNWVLKRNLISVFCNQIARYPCFHIRKNLT